MANTEERNRFFIPALIGVALLLCCGTPAYVGYRMWADPQTKAGMEQAATAYLDALRDGDYPAAYALVCDSERKKYPLAEWTSYNDEPDIESYRITEVAIVDQSEGPTLYHVRAELRYADGKTALWHYNLADESGGWRVCYDTWVDPQTG
ncbi:hypothetical protein [Catellatospora sp. NPDC049133]|uniref:Rv0361 family membrane protein n=1 Tax=Catellatospora sp. NPDC049133 TaxID=3155499 RepID=UPI0033E75FD1